MAKKVKLIRDGMNKPFRIAPFGDDGEVLTGQYRPMSSEEADAMREDARRDPKKRTPVVAKHLAKHVLKWDLEENVNEANIAALPPAHFDQLELVISGYANSGSQEEDEKKS